MSGSRGWRAPGESDDADDEFSDDELADDEFADDDDLPPPPPLEDAEVPGLVESLLGAATWRRARDELSPHAAQVRPALLEALDDPRYFAANDGGWVAAEALLLVLEEAPDDAVLARVRALTSHYSAAVRAGVARVLGRAGRLEDLALVRSLLSDPAEVVRDGCAIGLAHWCEAGAQPRAFGVGLLGALVESIRRSTIHGYSGAVKVLAELAGPGELERLAVPELLRPEVGLAGQVCAALRDLGVQAPVDALLTLLAGLDQREDAVGGYGDPRSDVIRLLARSDDLRVEGVLERYATGGQALPASFAAEALCARRGLDPDAVVRAAGDDLERYPPALRTYSLVVGFDYHIDNGGLSQFFSSGNGRWARETLAALRTIGATHAADLLQRACAAFGQGGPPRCDEARSVAVEGLERAAPGGRAFEELDSEHYDRREPIMALLLGYVLDHPDAFRPR